MSAENNPGIPDYARPNITEEDYVSNAIIGEIIKENEKLRKLVGAQGKFMDLYSDYPDEGCDCLKCKGARELRAEIAKLKTELE